MPRNSRQALWLIDGRLEPSTCTCCCLVFACGLAVNIHSDRILRNLRQPGESGYKIPHGGLFSLVSAPNYLGRFVRCGGGGIPSAAKGAKKVTTPLLHTPGQAPSAPVAPPNLFSSFPDFPLGSISLSFIKIICIIMYVGYSECRHVSLAGEMVEWWGWSLISGTQAGLWFAVFTSGKFTHIPHTHSPLVSQNSQKNCNV